MCLCVCVSCWINKKAMMIQPLQLNEIIYTHDRKEWNNLFITELSRSLHSYQQFTPFYGIIFEVERYLMHCIASERLPASELFSCYIQLLQLCQQNNEQACFSQLCYYNKYTGMTSSKNRFF